MKDNHLQWIADKIDELRKEQGITLEEIVLRTEDLKEKNPDKYAKISRTNLFKLRKCGTGTPRNKTLHALANALGKPDTFFLPSTQSLNEQEIEESAREYLLLHHIELDKPLDDVINDVLYKAYDTDIQPIINYFRTRGCEIEYDVIDELLLQESEKYLVAKKASNKEHPKRIKQYEKEIAQLQEELSKLTHPDEIDSDLDDLARYEIQDRYYEKIAELNEMMQDYENYKSENSTIPTHAEIHYRAKRTAIDTALATSKSLKEVPLIARISRPAVLFKDADEPTALPPIEINIYRFVEACKQMDALANFLLEL